MHCEKEKELFRHEVETNKAWKESYKSYSSMKPLNIETPPGRMMNRDARENWLKLSRLSGEALSDYVEHISNCVVCRARITK